MLNLSHEKLGANVNKVHLNNASYLLFSYETLVAFKCEDTVYEDNTNYSRTTNKHKTQFIQDRYIKETIELSPEDLQIQVTKYISNMLLNELGEIL